MADIALNKVVYAVLGALLLCSITLNRCQQERLDVLSAELDRAVQANLGQTAVLARLEAENRLNNGLLAKLEQSRRQIRQEEENISHALVQEGLENEHFKNWAAQPLPPAVLRVFQAAPDADANVAP
ncbi:MAG: hypothetical protein LBM00_05975 [Deltaproteobacteria bacterium]|jgi:hypothetical protein|nr:hypothetical protein [Deltaproteobacteria bacterium]